MPTPRFKSRQAFNNKSRRDWKDHPLAIAVAVAVATSVFFMTVVIPLRFDLLTAKVERLTELSTNALSISSELERTKRELSKAHAALQVLATRTPFKDKGVYPIGLDDVVIGTAKPDLESRYPYGEWDQELGIYSVKSKIDGVVREASYFIRDEKVNMILFHLNGREKAGAEVIRKHFLSTFGEPDATQRNRMLWKATNREWVNLEVRDGGDSGSYSVHASKSGVLINRFELR